MAPWPRLDARDTVRYGVFLRPDARTCEVTAWLHELLRRQFGLLAASVFAPHITLLGNIALRCAETELLARVDDATAGVTPFRLPNPGVRPFGDGLGCTFADERLSALARTVEDALAEVRARTDTDYLTGQTSTASFVPHLTVAGQDFGLRPDLQAEIAGFLTDLAPPFPPVLTAEWVSVFRFHSATWPALWWQDMTWQHLGSRRLDGE